MSKRGKVSSKPSSEKNSKKKGVAEKRDPALWEQVVKEVKAGNKYGKNDTWNARKAQYAVKLYKKLGGKYKGKKSWKNSLTRWTKRVWRYSSNEQNGNGRYLPSKVWAKLSPQEKAAQNRVKKEASKKGKKKAKYTKKVARLVKRSR